MKNLLVYPFSLYTVPLARYCECLTDYDQVIPVVEEGAGIPEGCDVSYIDGGNAIGVTMTTDFISAANISDGILFSSYVMNKNKVLTYLAVAKELGKKIYMCGELNVDLDNDIHGIIKLPSVSEVPSSIVPQDRLLMIPVPVILVFGHGPQCNKFDIQIYLRKKFCELGYKVSQVGTKRFCPLFGFQALPFYTDLPLWKKILAYNRYFRDIVKKESPDVLIVGVPGGITAIDEKHTEYFGETAISISKSLKPDVSIFSLYYGMLHSEYLRNVTDYAKFALDASLDFFHLSNTHLVFEQDMRNISYLTTDSSKVLDGLNASDSRLFSIFSHKSAENVFMQILCKLQDNQETV